MTQLSLNLTNRTVPAFRGHTTATNRVSVEFTTYEITPTSKVLTGYCGHSDLDSVRRDITERK